MSLKIYRLDTQKWTIMGSGYAGGVKVLDYENKFRNSNKSVESCLSELKDDLMEAQKAIKYIFDHGGNGEGGGGGGSYLPILNVLGDLEYTLTTDQELEIRYSFTSSNRGNGVIQLSGHGSIYEKAISQGTIYSWKVGPFEKGVYYLSMNVKDSQGFWSGAVTITINSGTLQLIDNFEHNQQFLPMQTVKVNYELSAASTDQVCMVDYVFNDVKTSVELRPGNKTWEVQMPNMKGVYKGSITARSGTLKSNVLEYSFIVADSQTLYITSNTPTAPEVVTTQVGSNFTIEYIVSMLGQQSYDTSYYVDNIYRDSVTTLNAVYTPWVVGNDLTLGTHELRIDTKTKDNLYRASLYFTVEVVSSNFEPMESISEGLIAHFESTGNMQDSLTRDTWKNKVSGSNITCKLYNFNYVSNGWVTVPRTTDLPRTGCLYDLPSEDENGNETILRFSGKSHAIIDYAPFVNGVAKGQGITIEVLYRTENTGDPNARVISCRNEPNSTTGFDVNCDTARMSTSYGESCSVGFNENEWIRMSFVVNRSDGIMRIYCNGILSGFANIQPLYGSDDGFKYDGNIILGASLQRHVVENADGTTTVTETMSEYANCDIRSVRIYNRALTNSEIVQNYIADIKIADEQMMIRKINGFEEGFKFTIPELTVFNAGDIDNSMLELPCTIKYDDPMNPTKNDTFYNSTIKWQGTSSLEYPIKNYTITLNKNGMPFYGWTPDDNWKPESRWTLKANYMDSSQSDNVGFSKFAYDIGKTNVVPLQKEKEGIRTNIDGFPIRFYVDNGNGKQFRGIYTFNIDRYSYNNYGFSTYTEDGTQTKDTRIFSYEFNVNNSTVFELDYTTEAKKYKAWMETVRYHLKHRYNGKTDDATEEIVEGNGTTEVLKNMDNHEDLMNLLEWMASFEDTVDDRAEWIRQLPQHFSVEHLIDYFLLAYMFGMIDNLGKNMVITNYGKDTDAEGNVLTIWYPNFYDADSILGLNNKGANVITPGAEMSTEYVTQDSRLWKWLIEDVDMWDRIKRKYMAFRSSVVNEDGDPFFTIDVMMSYFGGRVSDTIGQSLYNEDFEYKYIGAVQEAHRYMCQGSRRSFIQKWLTQRLLFLDSLFGYGDFEAQLLTLRTNVTGEKTIRIKTYSPQKTTIQFQAGSEPVVLTTNKDEFTDFVFNFTNGKDNELKIKGAKNLMVVEGIGDLEISAIDMVNAVNLTNIEIPRNSSLREIAIGENHKLRTIDVSYSLNLGSNYANGTVNQNKILDLSACENLRTIKCNNTKLEGIIFPVNGGVIETLECHNTKISTFKMTGQEYLKEINLTDCPNVTTINISKCDGLQKFNMPVSSVNEATFSQCYKLEEVNIDYTNYLKTFSMVECTGVKKLSMQGVGGKNINELDLTTLPNLEHLNISSSTAFEHIIFCKNPDGSNFNKLKYLNCDKSNIISIRYAVYDSDPNAKTFCNMKGMNNLEYCSFKQCTKLTSVKDLYFHINNPPAAFSNCINLETLTGDFELSGHVEGYGDENWEPGIIGFFERCYKLKDIPSKFVMKDVTSARSFFAFTRLIPYSVIRKTIRLMSDKCKDLSFFAYKAQGINDKITEDLFTTVPNVTSLRGFLRAYTTSDNVAPKGLTGNIPENIFSNLSQVTDLAMFFAYNDKLTGEIPAKLFRNCRDVGTIVAIFQGCKGLTGGIPSTLFSSNTKLHRPKQAFEDCSGLNGEIPMTLFKNNPQINNMERAFYRCTNLTGVLTSEFFNTNNGRNNKIENINAIFGECPKLTGSLSDNTFRYCASLKSADHVFYKCTGITGGIPEKLLYYCPKLETINAMLAYCTGLGSDPDVPATISKDFFINNSKLHTIRSIFNNCTNISGELPQELLKPLVSLKNAGYAFNNCRNLIINLDRYFFYYNTSLTYIDRIFYYCTGLSCVIPAKESHFETRYIDPEHPELGTEEIEVVDLPGLLDNNKNLTNASGLFGKCWNLVGSIPPELFRYNTLLKNLSRAFECCASLSGEYPEKLLYYCPDLEDTSYMFRNCDGLGLSYYDNEDETHMYAIPPRFLINNSKIRSVRSMWENLVTNEERVKNEHNYYGKTTNLRGEIPGQLFQPLGNSLTTVDHVFYGQSQLLGVLESRLFQQNTLLSNSTYAFFSCNNLTGLGTDLYSTCKKLADLSFAFAYCSGLRGQSFNYLALSTVTNKHHCFSGCTNLENYEDLLDAGWAE